MSNRLSILYPSLAAALACVALDIAPAMTANSTESYSPHADDVFPTRVFWGDMHLHTSYSVDASLFGNRALDPSVAYRFASGETVTSSSGLRARLQRPLDFLAVTDHSEYLGLLPQLWANDPQLLRYDIGRRWQAALADGDFPRLMSLWAEVPEEQVEGETFAGERFMQSVWERYASLADTFNQPGTFTTFIAYEWTGMRGMNNLHRNVIFADDEARTTQVLPFSSRDGAEPEELWSYLADYEERTGGRALAIPHNSNLSGGLMFLPKNAAGEPIDAAYASARSRWEPLLEVTQIKGDSEAHPLLSPNDEFADFGTWDVNLTMSRDQPWQAEQGQYEYARPALTMGLALRKQLGVNPFRLGLIGSTDSHTSLATADSDNFFGKFASTEPKPGRSLNTVIPQHPAMPGTVLENWEQLASGYAAVWARENTRESIFNALKRREVYASTGPRITLRFFGGWTFDESDAQRPDLARIGYRKGVPMGSELPPTDLASSPRFLVSAARDPLGANLDRVQIIKGWVDHTGNTNERIFDVAVSGARQPDDRGRVKRRVGNTVNPKDAAYRNSIGTPQLGAVWQDPTFDPREPAYYYVRVLEIPTPRWTAYDAARFKEALPEKVLTASQQRAYSSPVWYWPPGQQEPQITPRH